MTLPGDAYKSLEGIVGEGNISEDLAVRDSYAFNHDFGAGSQFYARPGAIILPGSAEEVQSIVKVCNRYGVIYKAHCTGWAKFSNLLVEGGLLVDLRRMNRILEIDEKNQFAVIEPYVTGGQLQAELMKLGYNCNIIGAGACVSILAGCTSGWGWGFSSFGYGIASRNLLGVEWVRPTGELVRLGSLGQGAGWFSSDGPGPSVRAILRGTGGALGGLGIFTKCATKIYHWPGPRTIDVAGRAPNYVLTKAIPNLVACTATFPSSENYTNALYKIGDAEIAFSLSRYGLFDGVLQATESSQAAYDLWKTGKFDPAKRGHFLVIGMQADTQAEMDWKLQVLEDIVAEEKGQIGGGPRDPESQRRRQFGYIKIDRPAVCFRPAQLGSSMGSQGAHDMVMKQYELGAKYKKEYVDSGKFLDDGYDNAYMMDIEGGAYSHIEELFHTDPVDPESAKAGHDFIQKITDEVPEKYHLSLPTLGIFFDPQVCLRYGSMMFNYHVWQTRVKKALDPKNVSDPTCYITENTGKEQ